MWKQSDLSEMLIRLHPFPSQNLPNDFASQWLYKDKDVCFCHSPHFHAPWPHWSPCSSLNIWDMFLPRSLPLLFPLPSELSPKIYTGFIYHFIQASVQMLSMQRGFPRPSYLNTNSLLPITCYLSTMFYHSSLKSIVLQYITYLFPYVCFL